MTRFQNDEARASLAAARHARLFELIRQDNLSREKESEFLQNTRMLSAQESFCAMAAHSLKQAS